MFFRRKHKRKKDKGKKHDEHEQQQEDVAVRFKTYVIEDAEIELGSCLGTGNFGKVYKGICRDTHVAVKTLGDEPLTGRLLEKFLMEIETMAAASHDNVIKIMGAATDGQVFKIVMELLDGDLKQLLETEEGSALDMFDRLCLAKQAAVGLRWLHDSTPAVIHSDLKLENLMYKRLGHKEYLVKVADFGLSLLKDKTKDKLLKARGGTPTSTAPEIMDGKPFDQSADVYSFAHCIWALLTGQELYPEYNDVASLAEAVCDRRERPPLDPKWPAGLRALLTDMWDHHPGKRPTMAEVNRRLDDVILMCAIEDPDGLEFWRTNFTKRGLGVKHYVSIGRFKKQLCEHFSLPMVIQVDNKNIEPFPMRCVAALLENDHSVYIKDFGKTLKWFGPFVSENQCFIEQITNTITEPWFHGEVKDEELKNKFKDHPAGAFLVRFSGMPGAFSVVYLNAANTLQKTRITKTAQGYAPQDLSRTFPSLKELIAEFKEVLMTPCKGSPYAYLIDEDGDLKVPLGYNTMMGLAHVDVDNGDDEGSSK